MNILRIIILLFCLGWLPLTSAAETIRITTGEFAPWTSATLKHMGFTNHVISEAFKLEGYDAEFKFYPWVRAYETARVGDKFQATSYWYPSDDRATEFFYSDPIQIDAPVFFHLKDNPPPDWETLDDLKGKRIGATTGFTYTKEFWEAAKSKRLDIEEASTQEQNFKKLLKGRIDLFPVDALVGQKVLLEAFGKRAADSVTYHSKPMFAPTGHLLFSKKTLNGEELLAAFNRGLSKLRASGRYTLFQTDLITGKYEQ
ncbi:MAG: transporter substrate-binding domain-containing protein [Gammaproteobacteria bacterium]|nr:transporter substrate-binding domain-containing protein [Gammaproteobacteria bacterium]